MSEQNKQIARDMWESMAKGDIDKIAALYDDNVLYHGSNGEERQGKAAVVELPTMYKQAFPDMKAEVEQIIAEGDFVATRVRGTGTNTGEFMGMPATNKKVDLRWVMNMIRVSNGKIVEEWEIFDQSDLMKQLGLA